MDLRQTSLLGAGWTLASVKHLAEAGADSVTLFEVNGPRGVLTGQEETPGAVPPLYFVLREIWGDNRGAADVLPWVSSDPLRVEGLSLRYRFADETYGVPCVSVWHRMLLANLTPELQRVHVPWAYDLAHLRLLDEMTARDVTLKPERFRGWIWLKAHDDAVEVALPPYALAVLQPRGADEP